MKVNDIQNHNTKPAFNALRFKNGSQNYISTMPKKVADKLEDIAKKLEDTTFYHLDIGRDSYYVSHKDGERYYLPILVNNAGKVFLIKFRQGLSQISFKLKYNTPNDVKKIYARVNAAPTQFERTAEIVKILDEYEKM